MDKTRVQRLMSSLALSGHEAVLLLNPSNIFYLSGYTGEGALLISNASCAVITDFRYTEQAEKQSPNFTVYMTGKDQTEEAVVNALCEKFQIREIYFESDAITVKAFEKYQATVKGIAWKPLTGEVEALREIKDVGELALIEKACLITSESFERILPQIQEGISEKELAVALEFDMRRHGADKMAFSTIVAAGVNGSLPHAVPSNYKIRRGDMITMDFGAKVGGYCADMTRTVALGEPSSEMKKVYQTVKEAQEMAQNAVMAGKSCKEIDSIARDHINAKGYEGRFGHGLGHSLGIDIHESPRLNTQTETLLRPGHLVTVEPGIYLPGVGGVRIENTVIVTETGCRALTLPTRELIILS